MDQCSIHFGPQISTIPHFHLDTAIIHGPDFLQKVGHPVGWIYPWNRLRACSNIRVFKKHFSQGNQKSTLSNIMCSMYMPGFNLLYKEILYFLLGPKSTSGQVPSFFPYSV